jgi:hypothetical protein
MLLTLMECSQAPVTSLLLGPQLNYKHRCPVSCPLNERCKTGGDRWGQVGTERLLLALNL